MIVKAVILASVTLVLKGLENISYFVYGFRDRSIGDKVMAIYSVVCVYVPIGIGIIGYYWALEEMNKSTTPPAGENYVRTVIVAFIVLVVSAASKGIMSRNRPNVIGWADRDWRWGVIVPNTLAFSLLIAVGSGVI